MIRGILFLALLTLTSGCAAVAFSAATTAGTIIADERTTGQQLDDVGIYAQVNRRFLESDANDLLTNVTINVRNGRVMLTGNVDKQETAERAIAEAWKVDHVKEVINEIAIRNGVNVPSNLNDALIKKNLEGRLFLTDGVMVTNYSIDVVSGVAYFLGRVKDQQELDKVFLIARTTKGVKKVVSHLQFMPTDPLAGHKQPVSEPHYGDEAEYPNYKR